MSDLEIERSARRRPMVRLIAFLVCLWALPVSALGSPLPARARTEADPVIAAAGDIACDPSSSSFKGGAGTANACRMRYTSDLLVNGAFGAVLQLGDEQYECGGSLAFMQSYDPSWGRVLDISHPAVGNHEYDQSGGTDCGSGASGYWNYFGARPGTPGEGWYSSTSGPGT